MKRPLARWLLVLVLLAAAIAGFRWATRPRPVSVRVAPVERGRVEDTVANTRAGTLKAGRRARLAPSAGGMVVELPVHVGERVRAGQLLLRLWNQDLEAQVKLADSELRSAAARKDQTCLLADQATREDQRLARLRADGIVDAQTAEEAKSNAEAQAAACRSAQAAIVQATAQLAVARAELAKTELRAPFDGVVAEVSTELGEVAIPSPPGIPTPPALDLIEQGGLYVSAPIDEVDAPQVRAGQQARVTFDALPGRVFAAHVRRVAPYVQDLEKQSRTVEVEAEIDDLPATSGLVPGYSADVEILLEARDNVLRVPTEAVQEGGRVLVLQDGRLVARTIHAGLANWQFTEVKDGLAQGERVVVSLDRAGVEAGVRATAETEPRAAAPPRPPS